MTNAITKHRLTALIGLVATLLVLGGFLWAYGSIGSGSGMGAPTPLILHFNDTEGITAVGTSADLIYAGILGLIMVLIDVLTALALEERDPVLAKLVAITGLLVAALLFIAFAAIINVN